MSWRIARLRRVALAALALPLLLALAQMPATAEPTPAPAAQSLCIGTPVANKLYGIDWSPYTQSGQAPPGAVPRAQIDQQLQTLCTASTWIRTYQAQSFSSDGANIAQLAQQYGFKTAVTAYLCNTWASCQQNNQSEINALVQAATSGYVDVAIVGNEPLLPAQNLTVQQVLDYTNEVRTALQGVKSNSGQPVQITIGFAYNDVSNPQLVGAVDFVMVNVYPWWAGTYGVSIDTALSNFQTNYNNVIVPNAQGKRVWIGETGWPSGGSSYGSAVPSPQNAATYAVQIIGWFRQQNIPYLYFEAFDEPWKGQYNSFEAFWGIWNGSLQPKPGMSALFQ